MSDRGQWLIDLEKKPSGNIPDGLIPVDQYDRSGRPPEEIRMMEKAASYQADFVFFEASQNGKAPVAQAFLFVSDVLDDAHFARLHQRLWSWGAVPLVYRKTRGLVQLFRCAHKPDFVSPDGEIVCRPIKTLAVSAAIAQHEGWWDAEQLRNGTLWDDPNVCKLMMSASKSAHKSLINAVKKLNQELNDESILKRHLRRRLLILSLLIAYLEERGIFAANYFGQFLKGASRFFQVLGNGKALVALLSDLEERFNGHVFTLEDSDRVALAASGQLSRFAHLVEAHEEVSGQLTLWQLYSFRDLPVELISHIYQQFVTENSAVYTPPFLVRLMLEEALSWDRMDRLEARGEIILDPACGSGVFLVEANKRLVLHWRSRNDWKRPRTADLKRLLKKVHGVDLEQGAIELAAFSLCLALCDALEPEEIRSSIK
ncbi:MAG: N-6 DNA methylase, partial [Xanthobacteraceae bacterium]